MTRVRQALLLILPLLRTTAWPAVAAAAVPGLATFSLDGPPQLAIRLAAVALCVGAAFTLGDAAAQIAAAAPTPLLSVACSVSYSPSEW